MSIADFVLLGLSVSASDDDVRKAYKKMALRWHPDKAYLHGVSVQTATEKFKEIGNAYLRLQAHSVGFKATSASTADPSTSNAGPFTSKQQRTPDPPSEADDYSDSEGFSEHNGSFSGTFFDNFFFDFSYKFFGADYSGDDSDFRTFDEHWKGNYAKQRSENVKKMYDRRDRKLSKTSKKEGRICDTCEKRDAISKTHALNSGVDWDEYKAQRWKTCWACKNAHKSVLTASMAKQQMSVLKKHPEVFDLLQQQRKYFCHQPVSNHVDYTRCSMYFWRVDLEEHATYLGWKSRAQGTNDRNKAIEAPKKAAKKEAEPKAKAAQKNTKKTTKKKETCSATTPGVSTRGKPKEIFTTATARDEETPKPSTSLFPGDIASSDGVLRTPSPQNRYHRQNVSDHSNVSLYGATRHGCVPGSPCLPQSGSGLGSVSLYSTASHDGASSRPHLAHTISAQSRDPLHGETSAGGTRTNPYPPLHRASARVSLSRHDTSENK